ncbi:alpha/beta fold hydrolase [Altererythrobacter sp. MF3-039]|uniref:alpha/beta fold hydrolase n=1 Tax=Altererythrobacter sp. MF3-039 TaxID=3252901 RepID=UPI00390C694D
MITRHILTIPETGRKVHYRRSGNGPVLLMAHQSPTSSKEYEPLMREWGGHFTCIAPDTPGFGQSDPLSGEPEIGEFADALAEFVNAMGIAGCAAYGFHSGGIILVGAVKRYPKLFSCLAVGGYAIWTDDEMRIFGESYLPEFRPSAYGEHLAWLWNRVLEQSWFFPWFDTRDEARLPGPHSDLERASLTVTCLLDSGSAYRAGYGAVLRAPRDIPDADAPTPPVLITAYQGDPLQPHIDRLGEMPANWSARKVKTPSDQQAASLAFLQQHAAPGDSPDLPEDPTEGWVSVGDALIHWRGTPGARRLITHAPADELSDPGADEIAIDVPGHGLSDDVGDIALSVEQAADALGASEIVWATPPQGDTDLLYPDVSPHRFGEHLQRAWGAARAEVFFKPWYVASRDNAIPVNQEALEPAALALRARARLRAGAAARQWHDALVARKKGQTQ